MLKLTYLTAAVLAGGLLTTTAADAGSRHVSRSWTGPAGRTASSHYDRVHAPGSLSASAGWTGRAGRSGGYQRSRQVDAANGFASTAYDRAYRDGTSRSVDRQATRQEPGVWAYDTIRTQRDGDVHGRSGVVTFPAAQP